MPGGVARRNPNLAGRRAPEVKIRQRRSRRAAAFALAEAAESGKIGPMTDADTPLQVLKDRVLAFAAERDWQQFHSPKNLAMALAAEAAELTEHFLWTEPAASHARAADPARRARIAEELADVLIYALEFANVTGLDLTAAALAKLEQNARKYPVEKARGRSEKYTEL